MDPRHERAPERPCSQEHRKRLQTCEQVDLENGVGDKTNFAQTGKHGHVAAPVDETNRINPIHDVQVKHESGSQLSAAYRGTSKLKYTSVITSSRKRYLRTMRRHDR